MARHPRSSKLETRTARLKLPVRKKPYTAKVAQGIRLAYRRNKGPGTWSVLAADGHGGTWLDRIAVADDFEDADGEHVLSFWQAQDKARQLVRGHDPGGKPATVADAIDDYARDLAARGGDALNATRARFHLTPVLLSRPVALLTAKELRRWRDSLVRLGLKPGTVNRTLKAVKAALNLAADHDPRITNRDAWRVGLAGLPDAHVARNVVLPDDDVRALIAAAWALDLARGLLVETAAVTGARVSQLARLEIGDLQDDRDVPRLMMPSSRKGRGYKRVERQPVPIPASLAAKLRAAAADRSATALLLLKSDYTPWRSWRSDHRDPFATIAVQVGLAGTTIYSLRHSSIVRLLLANVPIRLVAAHHDTSVAMIERTYGKYITDHGDALTRRALLDPATPSAENVVALTGRRS
jgi:integrase